MSLSDQLTSFLGAMLNRAGRPHPADLLRAETDQPTNVAGIEPPRFGETDEQPESLIHVKQPDGRLTSYPPTDRWDNWVEWDGRAWPRKVARRYTLVPTICFNCESGCGLLADESSRRYRLELMASRMLRVLTLVSH